MFTQREQALAGSFTQVGHEPLLNRGMNAALAVHKQYAYVGSRTDGKNGNANHAGVMVVDVKDPAKPFIANEMGPPYEGNPQESSRELRVWRSQDVLIVLHTNCGGATAHLCQTPSRSSFRYYDISRRERQDPEAAAPEHAGHARVLHLGGPEEPEARAAVRRQRRQPSPDL